MMKKHEVNWTLKTDGTTSYWSRRACEVQVTGLRIAYVNEEEEFGELRVYFDTKTWDVKRDGLIYTDKMFEEELRERLVLEGLCSIEAAKQVGYSEQGMQGNNYVSLDVGSRFLHEFKY